MVALVADEHLPVAAHEEGREGEFLAFAAGEPEAIAAQRFGQAVDPALIVGGEISQRPEPPNVAVAREATSVGVGEQVGFEPRRPFGQALRDGAVFDRFGEGVAAVYVPIAAGGAGQVGNRADLVRYAGGVEPEGVRRRDVPSAGCGSAASSESVARWHRF